MFAPSPRLRDWCPNCVTSWTSNASFSFDGRNLKKYVVAFFFHFLLMECLLKRRNLQSAMYTYWLICSSGIPYQLWTTLHFKTLQQHNYIWHCIQRWRSRNANSKKYFHKKPMLSITTSGHLGTFSNLRVLTYSSIFQALGLIRDSVIRVYIYARVNWKMKISFYH